MNISLLKTSKIQMALSLFVLSIGSIFLTRTPLGILPMVISITSCVLVDVLFIVIPNLFRNLHRPFFFPSAAIVSGLIIGILYSYQPYLYVFVASVIAMTIKNVVRVSNRHIFNPAASGLLITSLLFQQSLSWSSAPLFLFILPAFISLVRVRKYYLILSFLFLYTFLLTLLNHQNILSIIFDPTILFFSLVMLPEPMTSPFSKKLQLLFGGAVATFVLGISLLAIPLDPLLTSLLLANALFFKFR